MTAEERMQERAAQVCDLVWQQSNSLAISRIAGQLAENIRALPLEGEQDQRAPIKYRAELIFDHETRIIHGTIDEPQGEPAEDQGSGAMDRETLLAAAMVCRERGDSLREDVEVALEAYTCETAILALAEQQSAPHHHFPESVWKWKNEVQRCYPLANHEFMQGYLPQGGHIVWIDGRRERRDGALALSNTNSVENAWEDAAKEVQRRVSTGLVILEKQSEPAPAREPLDDITRGAQLVFPARESSAVEEVNAAKKEGCFITAVGSYYQNVIGLDLAIRHAEELDRLLAENAALREQLQGGVVVPREPTEAMLDAACHWRERLVVGEAPSIREQYRAFYRAMLAAAKETKE